MYVSGKVQYDKKISKMLLTYLSSSGKRFTTAMGMVSPTRVPELLPLKTTCPEAPVKSTDLMPRNSMSPVISEDEFASTKALQAPKPIAMTES